jgi:L-lactate dehydrogenase complex protein LldG
MTSREQILSAIKANQPEPTALPSLNGLGLESFNVVEKFRSVLEGISGACIEVQSEGEILSYLEQHFDPQKRWISNLPNLQTHCDTQWLHVAPHNLENVELGIFKGICAVAESGAIWVNEASLGQRVAPFICQYLVLVVPKESVFATLHQAYASGILQNEGFGGFIAGPSKTADIEQSLVIGAHGARGLTVFLLG